MAITSDSYDTPLEPPRGFQWGMTGRSNSREHLVKTEPFAHDAVCGVQLHVPSIHDAATYGKTCRKCCDALALELRQANRMES